VTGWYDRAVLVTGAGGFIGSHLAEALVRAGARVRALVRYNGAGNRGWLDTSPHAGEMEIVAGDITDRDSTHSAMRDIDTVFHLAALISIPHSYATPDAYVRVNVAGSLNLLQSARAAGVRRFVQTSTSEVYGDARHLPIAEDHPLCARSPYAASKIAAEKLAESFHAAFGLPVCVLRPFNTYGPRQSPRAVIPSIIGQCLAGSVVSLGAAAPTRDFTYIDDTVSGFMAAGLSDTAMGETINLGTGSEIAIDDLARRIARAMGQEIELVCAKERLRPEASEVQRLCSDNSKAARLMGWEPRTDLDEGLRQTIDWGRRHSYLLGGGRYRI
jgi:dTDP-glucose 4,6-dehydratase